MAPKSKFDARLQDPIFRVGLDALTREFDSDGEDVPDSPVPSHWEAVVPEVQDVGIQPQQPPVCNPFTLTLVLEHGMYYASVPELKLTTSGATKAEALTNIIQLAYSAMKQCIIVLVTKVIQEDQ